ncbi:flagellar hook-associated protein FlgK [Burkholderia plantarii]|uniref:flagellar hook-associated protein FlgK n=1 Tax=Burkholderia plantarii TaxID=41899 RepID=UPI0018DCF4C2|nr:flagellar hook-associated protein FlgK [Burkholderia plantarii]MBI0327078.1 flagellar hook-associated protein FlgK [Burkholderia plantarii]
MSNLLNIGLSGINAAQWGINTTGQNISNQATPGYSVERVVYAESDGQYTTNGFLPTGVSTVTVQRQYSQYLSDQLNTAQAASNSLSTYSQLVATLNNYIGSPTGGVASAISTYFSGLQNVSSSASSAASRATAISDAATLANQLTSAGAEFDSLRQSVNTQLQSAVTQVNSLTTQIAQLNQQITVASQGGQPPNQLLDQRDHAVATLQTIVGVQVVQSNGNYNVQMANGQPLVVGNTSYTMSTVPSPSDPSELAIGLQNTAAGSGAAGQVQVLSDNNITGGTIGGLLQFRSQTLDPAQAKLGAIAVSFASQVNAQNALGIDANGNVGGDLFSVGTPQTIANTNNTGDATITAGFADGQQPPTSDYTLSYDGSNYTLKDRYSGSVIGTATSLPATIGGLKLSVDDATKLKAGDSFTIEPTRSALDGFASVGTASTIAAASPVLATVGTTNAGSATITPGTVTAGYQMPSTTTTLTYHAASKSLTGFPAGTTVTINTTPPTSYPITDGTTQVPYDSTAGASLTITSTVQPPPSGVMNNVSMQISGSPTDGDTFKIAPGGASNDGRNAQALSNLVNSKAFDGGTTTLTTAYGSYVNGVGNTAAQLSAASTAQTALVNQITSQQQSVSGVNQDEEAVNLMQYQQMYQANAKVIQTASTLFSTLLGIFN